jgi:hypothetical protein
VGAVDADVTREEFPCAIRQVCDALSSNALARLRGYAEDGQHRRPRRCASGALVA